MSLFNRYVPFATPFLLDRNRSISPPFVTCSARRHPPELILALVACRSPFAPQWNGSRTNATYAANCHGTAIKSQASTLKHVERFIPPCFVFCRSTRAPLQIFARSTATFRLRIFTLSISSRDVMWTSSLFKTKLNQFGISYGCSRIWLASSSPWSFD